MIKAAWKPLHQRRTAWFRAALLVLFAAEAVAFDEWVGTAFLPNFACLTSVAGIFCMPFVVGSFRRPRSRAAFYAVFLFACVSLNFGPFLIAMRANKMLATALRRVQPGMTHEQTEQILLGYTPTACVLNDAPADYSVTAFHAVTYGPFSHSCSALVNYRSGTVTSTDFQDFYIIDGVLYRGDVLPYWFLLDTGRK